jgi:hypothetical protein
MLVPSSGRTSQVCVENSKADPCTGGSGVRGCAMVAGGE